MQKLKPQPRPTELESAFERALQAIWKFARDQKHYIITLGDYLFCSRGLHLGTDLAEEARFLF